MTAGWICGPLSRDDFPESLAYAWTKALAEHWDEVAVTYPAILEDIDPRHTPEVAGGMGLMLHPGAIRAYREMGVAIPDSVVPPEMK